MSHPSIIITIGDELLIGQTIDTNSAWIAQELNKMGISILKRIAIADDESEIINTLDSALDSAHVIIITGGLGPTQDDLTKASLCVYFGSRLIQDKKALAHIESIFKNKDTNVLLNNRKQADVPDNCKVLYNPLGTAPGMWFEKKGGVVISLPGVPHEMKAIMEKEVIPLLKQKFIGHNIYHKTLLVMGIGESALAELIEDIELGLPTGIKLAYLPDRGMVKLRLSGSGLNEATLRNSIDVEAEKIKLRLGLKCAAEKDTTIEAVISEMMKSHHLILGLAESCTGGYIAHKITNLPGSAEFFKGSIVSYSNEVKKSLLLVPDVVLNSVGAVSEETVKQMAEKAREILGVDYALSVSGILGPTGATAVKPIGMIWMAIASNQKTVTKVFYFKQDRMGNKDMAVNYGLDWLRLTLLEDKEAH